MGIAKKLKFGLWIGLWAIAAAAQAQIPANSIGANPAGLRWRKIDTQNIRIVFPAETEAQAQRVANLAEYLSSHHNEGVGNQQKKVTVFFHNQTVLPNGLVTVGPFRSEFQLTSPQFNTSSDWLDLLAIHEYEHVKQFANSNRGITGLVKTVMGSWPWGGFAATALPRWYWEGDATVMETALSASGRGRMPSFIMEQRALVLDGVDYGYEKAAAGSLRDFVPDHYSLGYYLVAHGKQQYGRELWSGVLADAVAYKGLFFPFSANLKKRTGLGTRGLYASMRRELDSLWRDNNRSTDPVLPPVNVRTGKTVEHFSSPQWLNNTDLVVEKRGYAEIPALVRLKADGKTEKLTSPGLLSAPPETTLSFANNRLAWAELDFDPRRSNRNFSVIRIFDLTTGRKTMLTHRSKLFAPALSPDGLKVACVEYSPEGNCRIVILDAADGRELQSLPNPDQFFYAFPAWSPGGDALVVVAQKNERHALHRIELAGQTATVLVPGYSTQLAHPASGGSYVFFTAAWSGISQVYAVRPGDPGIYQVTQSALGAFQPAVSPDGAFLAFSEFSKMGFNVVKMPVDPKGWQRVAPEAITPIPTYADILTRQEGGSIIPGIAAKKYEVTRFNRLSGILHPHSWLPVLDPPLYGARILSDNQFSTLSAEASALYNENEKEWSYSAGLSYAEWFPVVNLNYVYQNRAGGQLIFTPENDSTVIFTSYNERWKENKWTAGVHIPLNFSQGNTFQRVDGIVNMDVIQLDADGRFDRPGNFRDTLKLERGGANRLSDLYFPPLADGNFKALDLRLRWILFRRQAIQHLNPKFGLLADIRYRTTLGADRFNGENLLLRSDLYFPGLTRNHSFFINLAYQQNELLDNYRFPDFFPYPRGYDGLLGSNIFKLGLNYSLPICYPDWAAGPLAFLKRIKANAFFDYGRVENKSPFTSAESFSSAGLELRFDLRLLRLVEADLGVRYSYLLNQGYAPQGQVHQFEFLVISLSN